jgi:uncharacterized SAM-binding protein YcdF (DUF218 family)
MTSLGRRTRRIGYAVLLVVLIWGAGLTWFAGQIPRAAGVALVPTDAAVVLTGGSGRLDVGIDLLEQGWAGTLFVSGVYERVDVHTLLDLFRRQDPQLACCIELGYAAGNTRGNAIETVDWARRKGVSSITLVTSNYHIPRANYEFGRYLSGISIQLHPVLPDRYDIENWWRDIATFKLVAWEYSKFLLAHVSSWIGLEPDLVLNVGGAGP